MGVAVEKEARVRRARQESVKRPSLRSRMASNSAYTYKAKSGGIAKPRVASRDVVIKAVGKGTTARGIKNGIDYITREGELEAYHYDGLGNDFSGRGDDFNAMVTDNMTRRNDYSAQCRGENLTHVKNLVFSPPPCEEVKREDMLAVVTEQLKETYPDHAFVAVYHEDKEKHPHVHVNIKMRNEATGRRLHISNEERRAMREELATRLQGMGYDVTAKHKWARFIERKHSPEQGHDVTKSQDEDKARSRNIYRYVDSGRAPYQHKQGANNSEYLTYETQNGEQVTLWGKGLAERCQAEKLEYGDYMRVKKMEQTIVRAPRFDNDHNIIGWVDAKRNNWDIQGFGQDLDRAQAYEHPEPDASKRETITKSLDASGIEQQLARKEERQQELAFMREQGFPKHSKEHQQQLERTRKDRGHHLGFDLLD